MLLALPNPTAHFSSPLILYPTPLSLSPSLFLMAELCELIVAALVSVVVVAAAASDLFTRLFSLFSFLSFSYFLFSCFPIFFFCYFAKFIEFSSANRTTAQAKPSRSVPIRFDSIHNARQRQRATSVRRVFIFGNDFKRISRCDKHSCKQIKSKAERERE